MTEKIQKAGFAQCGLNPARFSPGDCGEIGCLAAQNESLTQVFEKLRVLRWSRSGQMRLASPLCHERRHGGSIGPEGFESQVGMKRGKEHGDRSLTVSYSISC